MSKTIVIPEMTCSYNDAQDVLTINGVSYDAEDEKDISRVITRHIENQIKESGGFDVTN